MSVRGSRDILNPLKRGWEGGGRGREVEREREKQRETGKKVSCLP